MKQTRKAEHKMSALLPTLTALPPPLTALPIFISFGLLNDLNGSCRSRCLSSQSWIRLITLRPSHGHRSL